MAKQNRVKLCWEFGNSERSILAYLDERKSKEKKKTPLLSWVEPSFPDEQWWYPEASERVQANWLAQRGWPCVPPELGSIPLAEARVFWNKKMLHLVATDEGSRWCLYWESQEEKGRVFTYEDTSIYMRRDWARFGLEASDSFEQVLVRSYFDGAQLFAWRCILPKAR